MEDPLVVYLLDRYNKADAQRAPFLNDWMDIRDLVRPISVGYNKMTGSYTTLRTQFMYDGTAPDALGELAAALHSYTTNPAERWFEIGIEDQYDLTQDPDALEWLERISDIIYYYYCREDAMMNQALHEVYLDVASFGTGVLCQEWSSVIRGILFRSFPVTDCFFLENNEGRVDSIFRQVLWNLRQVEQEFGFIPEKLAREKNQERQFEILHCTFPRTDRVPGNPFQKGKAIGSVWISVSTKELLRVSGYDSSPYHTPRWTKLAGEIYGRGPAKICLPDIKMLNAMEKTMLKAGQKAVDPPLVLANEGFLLPIKTSPGALIYKEVGTENPEPLKFEGNLQWGLEQSNQKREFIKRCFYAEWIKMEKENVEMTAYEVQDRREEKLRLMAPMLGRLVSELHGPMIQRSYSLLSDRGLIPPAPIGLAGKTLKVGYRSPASRAQLGVKAISMSKFLQELLPFAQVDPGIMDTVDMDRYAQEMAIARGVPRVILRSKEEIDSLRQEKQQANMMAQAAQLAQPATQAVKNLADANAKGGIPALGM